MSTGTEVSGGQERDSADLARFGYKQELRRSLGTFSSFAVAFSYISPSTGIFTLFALGLTTIGGVFIWTWPVVALGQFLAQNTIVRKNAVQFGYDEIACRMVRGCDRVTGTFPLHGDGVPVVLG